MERISCDMGTIKYPNLHEIISQISFEGVWRIFSSKYIDSPLGMGYNSSRFSAPNKEFKVLRLLRNRFVALSYLEFGQIDWQNAGFWHKKSAKTRNFRSLGIGSCISQQSRIVRRW